MNEFEKWEKRFYKTHQGWNHYTPNCKLGWNAALKWILNEMNTDNLKDNGELRTLIEEELRFGN